MDQKTTGELMQVLNHLSDQSELTDYLNELEESPPESFLEYFHAFANVQSMPKTGLLQRDAILIFCINRGITNHMDVNELLDQFGENLLVEEKG